MHFGSCLLPLLPSLLRKPESGSSLSIEGLPAEVAGAIICADGALTPNFDYISALRESAARAAAARAHRRSLLERSLTVELVGHLFDSGVVGRVLDAIEATGEASVRILHCSVGRDRSTPTHMLLRISAPAAGCVAERLSRSAALGT